MSGGKEETERRKELNDQSRSSIAPKPAREGEARKGEVREGVTESTAAQLSRPTPPPPRNRLHDCNRGWRRLIANRVFTKAADAKRGRTTKSNYRKKDHEPISRRKPTRGPPTTRGTAAHHRRAAHTQRYWLRLALSHADHIRHHSGREKEAAKALRTLPRGPPHTLPAVRTEHTRQSSQRGSGSGFVRKESVHSRSPADPPPIASTARSRGARGECENGGRRRKERRKTDEQAQQKSGEVRPGGKTSTIAESASDSPSDVQAVIAPSDSTDTVPHASDERNGQSRQTAMFGIAAIRS